MSKELGQAALNKLISKALESNPVYLELQKSFREQLNKKTHVLDISNKSLRVNLKNSSSEELDLFNTCYEEFIDLIYTSSSQVIPSINHLKDIPKGTTFIENPPLLINTSFEAARKFVTDRISKVIPDNPYFGITNRARTLAELIALGWTKQELKDKGRFFNLQGFEKLSKYSKLLKVQPLSVLDIGHTYTGETTRESPLASKIESALKIVEPSSAVYSLLESKLNSLAELQADCGYTFKNNIPEGLSKGGFLTLTLHFYKKNGEFAKVEGQIYSQILQGIKKDIIKQLMVIPGSNTMEQDILALIKQELTNGIKGTNKHNTIPQHALLANTVKSKPKKSNILLGKSGSVSVSKQKAVLVDIAQDTSYSLASLQQLINDSLQHVIAANMGSGSETRILNYRTGRFAASAQVERMSQSREGMITAFYSYMKNPYQTFEPGFRQGSPQTRDPKLLIAKSIREIAATKVGNRLRAVSI